MWRFRWGDWIADNLLETARAAHGVRGAIAVTMAALLLLSAAVAVAIVSFLIVWVLAWVLLTLLDVL